jgi:hypothetical protein
MNYKLQKAGGVAATGASLAYITGFTVLIFLLTPENEEMLSNTERLNFFLDNKILFQIWILIIYVFFGIALVVLTTALHERLKKYSTAILQIASIFGYIWAGMVIASGMIANVGLETVAKIYANNKEQATATWLSVDIIHNGIGGGVEIAGGLWVLLISWGGLKFNSLPKLLNFIGLIVGITGILTAIPGLSNLGAVFGLLQLVWFAWMGVFLLRNSQY